MRLSGKTQPIILLYLIRNNPVKNTVMIIVEVKEPAALITIVPYQAIKTLLRMP